MISKIKIQNFQSHKDTEIELAAGVNAISGRSDNGKSAIIRALNWVVSNRPTGWSFKNFDCGEQGKTVVEVDFDSGDSLVRQKSKSINEYLLNGEIFTAIKSDVPQEVQDLLDMPDYALQTQHEPFFLLQNSAGDVAKRLNAICGLSVIDTAFSVASKKTNHTKKELDILLEQRQRTETDLKQYDDVEAQNADLEELLLLEKQLEEKRKKLGDLSDDVSTMNITLRRIDLLPDCSGAVKILTDLEAIWEKITPLQEHCSSVGNSIEKLNEIKTTLQLHKNDYEGAEILIQEAESVLELHKNVSTSEADLKKALKLLTATSLGCLEMDKEIEKAEEKERQLAEELKLCPVCGSEL